ncbi:MAG: glycosyltransferase family 2 protein [Alphaproteobacteria bacterium]|nr:glycosyltransferase family 2 protein [Alphaproteobacteria bacterium]
MTDTPDKTWDRVTVVIVVHNSSAVIGECLDVFGTDKRIVLVDNASHDNTLDIVRAKAPQAHIVHNPVGLGYGTAASQGLELVETEYALMMNPDAVFEPGTIERLVADADADRSIGMIGPLLPLPQGGYDRSWNGPFEWRSRMPSRRDDEPRPEGPFCTWCISGAVNLLRHEAARKIGYFDRAIFLYYEDDDLCMRLMRAGYTVQIDPRAEATHAVGGSVGTGWDKFYEKYYHMAWSRLYFEAKYVSPPSALRLGLKQAFRYGLKGGLYTLSFNKRKGMRDRARFMGSLAYLLGVPASKTTTRARPESAA